MSTLARRRSPVRTGGQHFEGFCRTYCRHTKGPLQGKPLDFEGWQGKMWKEALRLDKRGRRVYSFLLSGRPRKNYKTTECAALGLYLTGPEGEPGPEVVVGSGTREQAGFTFTQARDFVDADAELSAFFRTQTNVIVAPSVMGVMKRISSEGKHQLGFNLSGAVIDELQVFESERDRVLYSAIVTATAIREQPFIATITNAGFDKTTLLGELYTAALELPDVERFGKHGELVVCRDLDAGFLMWWYGAQEGADWEDRGLWRAVNPARLVSMDFLERQWASPAVSAGEFARFHLNAWTSSVDKWIADSIWRAGAAELEVEEGAEVWLAVDAALTYDTTAIDIAWPLPDGSGRVLHDARVWSARLDVPHDVFVPGGRIDNTLVEEYVYGLANRFRVRELVYDPRYFEDVATRLGRAGLRVAPMQPATGLMNDATTRFFVDVHEGKVLHRAGEAGAVLTQHVDAASAVKTEGGWKVSKRAARRPIDALIAMVMAHSRAARRRQSVYETRGLLVIGEEAEEEGRPSQRSLDLDDEDEDW